MSRAVKGAPSCQVTSERRWYVTFILPSGCTTIDPSASDGTRLASRPIGRRLSVSDVMSPFECSSFIDCQPPEVVPLPNTPIDDTPAVTPTVRDLLARCAGWAGAWDWPLGADGL